MKKLFAVSYQPSAGAWGLWAVLLLTTVARAEQPDWTPEVFDYERPARLEVVEKGEPENKLPETRQVELIFRNLHGEDVPIRMTFPPRGKGPWPAVVLVHALGSDRVQISRDLSRAMLAKGFACVAMDLPGHGDRTAKGIKSGERFVDTDPVKTYRNIVAAITDIRQTIDLVAQRKEFDVDRGVPVVGYSLGAWFATVASAADRRVSSLVLQGGGAADSAEGDQKKALEAQHAVLQRYPTVRAENAISHFGPRPILMQNGKKDPFISQESAKVLYRLAQPPKELKWYDCGHILPDKAAEDAAEWLAKVKADRR